MSSPVSADCRTVRRNRTPQRAHRRACRGLAALAQPALASVSHQKDERSRDHIQKQSDHVFRLWPRAYRCLAFGGPCARRRESIDPPRSNPRTIDALVDCRCSRQRSAFALTREPPLDPKDWDSVSENRYLYYDATLTGADRICKKITRSLKTGASGLWAIGAGW